MKKLFAVFLLFLSSFAFFASAQTVQTGKHIGEKRFFEYSIEYLDSQGVTTADSSGITFKPFYYGWSFLPTVLPAAYFGDYPLYFSGETLQFKVHVKNIGPRVFQNIKVVAIQERLNSDGGRGLDIGDQNISEWFLERIGPGEEIALDGVFDIPLVGESGLDQTHLQILHWPQKDHDREVGPGRIIVDDFHAGIWCPSIRES